MTLGSLGRRLVEAVFAALPEGLEIEAWVRAFNGTSLRATPRLGFDLARVVRDRGREVYVFTPES